MSAVVGELLKAAVRGPEPSVSARALVDAAGGTSAVARQIAGVGNTRPKDMTAEARRRYNAALRRVQRWVTSGAESRAGGFERLDPNVRRRLVRQAWADQERRRWRELEARGGFFRLVGAEVSDETPQAGRAPRTRRRTLPAEGTPGKFIGPRRIGDLRALLLEQPPQVEEAGEVFVTAFFTEGDDYVWDFEPEVLDVDELRVWPEGTDEGSW